MPSLFPRLLRQPVVNLSLRWVLIIPFVVQTVGAVTLVGYLSYRSGQQATQNLVNQLLWQTSKRVNDRLGSYLNTSQQIVAANHFAVEQGALDLNNQEQLRQHLWQQMALDPSIPAVGYWSDRGNGLVYGRILSKEEQGFVTQILGQTPPIGTLYLSENNLTQRRFYQIDAQGKPKKLVYTSEIGDRDLSWYRQAKMMGKPHWTPVYFNQIVPMLQIGAVAPAYDSAGQLQGLFISNYFLSEISAFLSMLHFSAAGQIFIVERSGHLIATSVESEAGGRQLMNGKPNRLAAIYSQDHRTRTIAEHLFQKFGTLYRINDVQHLSLMIDGERQFVQVMPYQNNSGLNWLIVIAIPESDFMTEIQRNTHTTIFLCLLALGIAIVSGAAISNCVTIHLTRLNRASQKLAAGDLTQQLPMDSTIVEVQELAQSFNQMSAQLQQLFQSQVETEATRQSEARFQQLAAAIPGMIYTCTQHPDGSFGFEYASSASREILELEPEQVIADVNAVLDQIHPDDRSTYDAVAIQSMALLEPFVLTFRNITPSGQLKWLEASSRPLQQENGNLNWCGILLDISDRKAAEAVLTEKTAFLNEAQRIAKLGSWSCDLLSGKRWWSPQMYQIKGLNPEDYLVPPDIATATANIYPEDRERVRQAAKAAIEQGIPYEIESRLLRPDGSICYTFSTGLVERNAEGEVVRFWGISQDITERKQAEIALQESEANLKRAQEIAQCGNWNYDVATGQIYWSEELYRIHNLDLGQPIPIGEAAICFFHPDDHAKYRQEILQKAEAGEAFGTDLRILNQDGSIRYIESRGEPVFDERHQITGLRGTVQDVTDRKLTEISLQQALQELTHHVETSPLATIRWNREFRVERWSKQAEAIFGWTAEEVLGKTMDEWPFIFEDDLDHVNQVAAQLMQGVGTVCQNRNYHKNGSVLYCEWYNSILLDEQGHLVSILSLAQDMSDRKQAEAELQRAKEAAETANLAKTTFLANMSHELRTPLNAILGFAQLLKQNTALPAESLEYSKVIYSSGTYLLKLINEILDLSKIETGKVPLEKQTVDLLNLLQLLKNTFMQRANQKGIQLEFKTSPDIPQYVITDFQKLQQVLINLIDNAIKFTEKGHVTLRVGLGEWNLASLEAWKRDRSNALISTTAALVPLCFTVEDSGVGIAVQDLPIIFDAFAQAEAGKQVQEGTGLGLTISRKLVQLMGGEVMASSAIGQGSLFQFTIPVEPTSRSEMQFEPPQQQVVGLAPDQPSYRILVVDDHPENRLLLVKLLEQVGLDVQEAATGKEAMIRWREWQPHLIWMDVRLSDLNGYEITQQIRTMEQSAEFLAAAPTVIIALTAQASVRDHDLALAAGCNDYLRKPFLTETLFCKMAEHLHIRYVYADSNQELSLDQPAILTEPLTINSLMAMSSDWITQLHRATMACDQEEVEQLIQQIPSDHAALAFSLESLTQDFAFDRILQLTQTCLDRHKSE